MYCLPAVDAKYKNGLPLLGLCDHAFLPFLRKLRAYLVRYGERRKDKLSDYGVQLDSWGLPARANSCDRDGNYSVHGPLCDAYIEAVLNPLFNPYELLSVELANYGFRRLSPQRAGQGVDFACWYAYEYPNDHVLGLNRCNQGGELLDLLLFEGPEPNKSLDQL